MKEYDVYLFDFDGTLCDSAKSLGPVFVHGFEAIGMKCEPEDALEYMHYSLKETADKRGVREDQWQPFVDEIVRALDYEDSLRLISFFPETAEVIKELARRGKRMAVVSNNTVGHINLVLERFGLSGIFEVISGSDVVSKFKPEPEPILYVLDKLGLSSGSNIVYIGDSDQDVECGKRAHVDVILINRAGDRRGDNVIADLKELFES